MLIIIINQIDEEWRVVTIHIDCPDLIVFC